jgi:hypothetical protein
MTDDKPWYVRFFEAVCPCCDAGSLGGGQSDNKSGLNPQMIILDDLFLREVWGGFLVSK